MENKLLNYKTMLDKLIEEIIHNRISADELKTYYNNDIRNVYSIPNYELYYFRNLELLKDIDKGSDILLESISKDKTIVVSCDFDADGIPGCKVLTYSLRKIFNYKHNIIPVIGGRRYGRGLCPYVVSKIKLIKEVLKRDVDLLITIDHGTTDNNAYIELKKYYPNMKIIVTDHHIVEKDLYPHVADAFINPQREDSKFSKKICGNMVIFLLLYFTFTKKTGIKYLSAFEPIIPYVAISTITDMMSMKEPLNRYIVLYAIKMLNDVNYTHAYFNRLKYIFKKLDLNSDITYKDISLYIGPFINTGNRLGAEHTMLSSLLLEDKTKYEKYVDVMIRLNKYRKTEVNFLTSKIMSEFTFTENDYGIMLTITDTKSILSGIVAGNISSMYSRPTICFTDTGNDVIVGSGRSGIENLNTLEIIRKIQEDNPDLILSSNGHASAFGITIKRENLSKFKYIFNKYCETVIKSIPLKDLTHEFELKSEDLTITLARRVLETGPYGLEFNNPIFLIKDLIIIEIVPIRTFFKLKLKTIDGKQFLTGMFFFKTKTKLGINFNNFTTFIKKNSKVNILTNISTSTYRNMSYVSLDILDILSSDVLL